MKNVFSEIEKILSFCISVEGDTFEQYFWDFFLWNKTLCIGLSLKKKKLILSNIIVEKIEKLIGTELLWHPVNVISAYWLEMTGLLEQTGMSILYIYRIINGNHSIF